MVRSTSTSSPCFTTSCPVSVKRPITVASTSSAAKRRSSSASCSGGTESTMRSWASLIQTSTGFRPSYLRGAFSSHTSAPMSAPISPTALENPPAPQSVTAV